MAAATSRHPRRHSARTAAPPAPGPADAPAKPGSGATTSFIEPETRQAMICDAAYFLSERRGFCPGREIDDWLAAEQQIDRSLASGATAAGSGDWEHAAG